MGDYVIIIKRITLYLQEITIHDWINEGMAKQMNRNIDIKDRRVQQSDSKLDSFLKAECISEKNYLEYYAGMGTLDKVICIMH